jgi:hypothetical protein
MSAKLWPKYFAFARITKAEYCGDAAVRRGQCWSADTRGLNATYMLQELVASVVLEQYNLHLKVADRV